jgi:ABC-type multidrug transport system permease subunit
MPFLPLLLGIAPTVASWIMGDKTGAAVTKITGIDRNLLGTDDATDMERAIAADPNLALQFKMAIIQAEADARRQQFDTLQAQLADVASARSQTVKLAETGSAIAWGAPIISTLITFGFFAMLYLVIRQEIPESSQTLANIMLGSLGTSFTAVVGYWVGSSAGSAQKTSALEKIARG